MEREGMQAMDQRRKAPPSAGPPSRAFREAATLAHERLTALFEAAGGVLPDEVAGSWWRGLNLHPAAAPLGLAGFFKWMEPPSGDGSLRGRVVLAADAPLGRPWRPRLGARGVLTFRVLTAATRTAPPHPGALVVSYRDAPGASRLPPVGWVVDYVVRPWPDAPDVLLGLCRAEVGARAFFLEWFLMERVAERAPAGDAPGEGATDSP